ncbi:helix-turn-helix domain-containing protein [Streptomyces violascens]|uniref:helix-turn-helix domain-containing protein n=1 Tax=Streptomyces violascens TaxID=67381 RepID=UPI001CFE22D1|nr:helix-turn-helix domain-containing protein [Streptomyces violascens]
MIELNRSGLRVPAIAVELNCRQKTARCWLHRFNRCGLQGLEDLGGQGRKRRITEADHRRGMLQEHLPGEDRPAGSV